MKIRRDILVVIAIPIFFVLSLQFVLALTIPETQLTEELPSSFHITYDPNQITITDVEYRAPGRNYCTATIFTTGGDGGTYEIEVTFYDVNEEYIYATTETEISINIEGNGSGSNSTAVVDSHIMSPILTAAVIEEGDIIKIVIRHNNITELLTNLFVQIDSV
ncbi:hypothetical protein HN807_00275 [Candidatus Bathyarchaeota archaeon]|jgi:hypothetical protein|nr:hypothetical protein [Candidatus Bathyarchaeota archaeon]MBT7186611.1 hypothetical protein [Candidatus Bathyarchaeota archaeon]MBT7345503.1 hypothetical protein [Candidatus Bathyarchaeota archaeon]